ncbi:hypothetical protein MRB53_006965 [Persea americana]|uniref:Uncharacterized protein n=1 Tax=Persea americana TaxID=3435 RepID=A0ACC2MHN1_PERAE|nr:hypothetical protein MRB53_006965 [Persea americana]
MAIKTFSIFWIFTFILMSQAFIAPCTQGSRPMGPRGGNMVSHDTNLQVNGFHQMFPRLSKSLDVPLTSARTVPTGPDPLHHHNHSPLEPFP